MKIDRFELHIINNNNNIDGHSGICEQQKYCLAGQEIKGRVEIAVRERLRVARLSLRLIGISHTDWCDTNNVEYESNELFLDEYKDLTSDLSIFCNETMEILWGDHKIHFALKLPMESISIIKKNGFGYVKYTLIATLPRRFSPNYRHPLCIISPIPVQNPYYGPYLRKKYDDKNYVTFNLDTSVDGCGGMGNMMWRIASIHSIGKYLNRIVYLERPEKCFHEYKEEFQDIFEDFTDKFRFLKPNPKPNETKIIYFGEECCRFDTPERIIDEKAQILKLNGNYFQSYKYFKYAKLNIHQFFKFKKSIIVRAHEFAAKINLKLEQFNFCVHTRRDDFVEFGQSSSLRFTDRSIAFVIHHLKKRFDKISAIVLLGNDKNFLNHIDLDGMNDTKVYMPGIRNRGVDLFFAKTYCNALLITAPTSTFSWWIGYLMRDESPIYYYNCQKECQHINKRNFFPTNWLPLHVDYKGDIQIDDNPL